MKKSRSDKMYLIWKNKVIKYISKILNKIPDVMNESQLQKMFNEYFHPYTASVHIIIKSKEYQNNEIYHDFIIPYEKRVVIVECNRL